MKNLKEIIIGALCVMVCILLWQGCRKNADKENLLNQISQYKLSEKAFTQKRLADSSSIAQQSQTILTEREATRLGLIKMEGQIKKLAAQVSQSQQVRYDSILVPYTPNKFADTSGWYGDLLAGEVNRQIIDSLIANSIIVPKSFSKAEKWLTLDGKVEKEGIVIDSLTIKNESTVSVGWKNGGFLGLKKIPIVEVKNTNPFISISKLNNVVIQEQKSLFQKKGFWIGVGVAIPLILKTLLK